MVIKDDKSNVELIFKILSKLDIVLSIKNKLLIRETKNVIEFNIKSKGENIV